MGESRTPMLAGDVLQRERFPFVSWARANGFKYPAAAEPLLQRCESAAEAYFLRAFVDRPSVEILGAEGARVGDTFVEIQKASRLARIDAVVHRYKLRLSLAVEIDGMGFHHANADQVESDYLRERRLVHDGYAVVRFTAREVFRDPQECWRQIDAILDAWLAAQHTEDESREWFAREYPKAIAAETL
jgi:very-short-patch-repair endonuclease